MKKKILFSALVIMIIAAAFGAGTMAWFTAKAEAPENEFTAGTVMIEAGGSLIRSQYFDPQDGVFVYGIVEATGDIYEIDPRNKIENIIYVNPNTYSPNWYPNALAFDSANDRLFFTGSRNTLFYYDFSLDTLVNADPDNVFTNVNDVLGATFGGGYYWYIPDNTADLYKVSFNNDGMVETITSVKMTEDYILRMGDVVIDYADGIIYGSATGWGSSNGVFFTYNTNTGQFSEVDDATAINVQLAWGSDGVLYAHRIGTRQWYEIVPPEGGVLSSLGYQSVNKYNDLASGHTSYWNPGDCAWKKYTVKNTGSKDIRVRLKLNGEWEFDWQWLWENWDALCFSEIADKPAAMEGEVWEAFKVYVLALPDPVTFVLCDPYQNDWVYDNGYWYYTGSEYNPIETGDELELCIKVCLDGEGATNEFQGGRFKLHAMFEAVQASNYAPYHEWGGVEFYGTP